MADIVVLGSLNMDLVVRTERMPQPGETVRGRDLVMVPGGKGANQAAAAARLGAGVEMVGRVGADGFGTALLANMRAQGVGVDHVRSDAGAATGTAMIIVDDRGENSIVVAAGANDHVCLEDILLARDLLAGSRYLMMQFEIPLPVVRGAIDLAQELGVQVILNAAPALAIGPEAVRGTYCLMANEHEARAMTGLAVDDLDAAHAAARSLLAWGIPVVILTLGPRGALLATSERMLHVPARKVHVVDTTAAGDAFAGGFASGLLKGLDLAEATRYAVCTGTLATTVLGAQPSLPLAAQVDAFYGEDDPD
ncbi:MAG: ribokinase [Anaerolineae bacterium]